MCGGPVFMVAPNYGYESFPIGPRKIVVANPDDLQPVYVEPQKASNCMNCGAPHEPVCSYCGTTA